MWKKINKGERKLLRSHDQLETVFRKGLKIGGKNTPSGTWRTLESLLKTLNKETKSCKGQLLPINGILNYLTVLSLDILNFSLKLSGIHRLDVKINALFSFTTPNEASVSMPWKLSSILSLWRWPNLISPSLTYLTSASPDSSSFPAI